MMMMITTIITNKIPKMEPKIGASGEGFVTVRPKKQKVIILKKILHLRINHGVEFKSENCLKWLLSDGRLKFVVSHQKSQKVKFPIHKNAPSSLLQNNCFQFWKKCLLIKFGKKIQCF